MSTTLVNLAYLVAAVLFILGLKGLTHPRTAVRGNLTGSAGMLLAAIATVILLEPSALGVTLVTAGVIFGASVGTMLALKIQMTAMPQLVALFNGFGGGASVLVAGASLVDPASTGGTEMDALIATAVAGFIGAVTFSGSLIAFAKLQGLGFVKDVRFPGQQLLDVLLTVGCIALGGLLVMYPQTPITYGGVVLLALLLGVVLVISIGGADMPVVIALLNSYSGLAAAATGFVLANNVLIIAGSLVGASGLILTQIMCRAMNRSLGDVLFGTLGPAEGTAATDEDVYATVKSTSPEEVAMLLEVARRVVIVPGYGMAVAQAQHAVRDLANLLQKRGIDVEFGIHPVAGRMPGHMNVLLAEADIPYDTLKEMEEINPTMGQADVTIVLGANDVVNPVARTDPSSPIAGMPIIDVDKSRTVVVVKRSLSPGFAGIANPLFAGENTLMLFGDAKKAVFDIISAVEEA